MDDSIYTVVCLIVINCGSSARSLTSDLYRTWKRKRAALTVRVAMSKVKYWVGSHLPGSTGTSEVPPKIFIYRIRNEKVNRIQLPNRKYGFQDDGSVLPWSKAQYWNFNRLLRDNFTIISEGRPVLSTPCRHSFNFFPHHYTSYSCRSSFPYPILPHFNCGLWQATSKDFLRDVYAPAGRVLYSAQ